jgi:hypothetical protein
MEKSSDRNEGRQSKTGAESTGTSPRVEERRRSKQASRETRRMGLRRISKEESEGERDEEAAAVRKKTAKRKERSPAVEGSLPGKYWQSCI